MSQNEINEVGGLLSKYFTTFKKNWIFQFLNRGTHCLQNYFHKPLFIKNDQILNTVKISFFEAAVPLVKFAIEYIKVTKKKSQSGYPSQI